MKKAKHGHPVPIEIMGLSPGMVKRIKALQKGKGLPKELEIEITDDGVIKIDSPSDFDHDIIIQELEALGIRVVSERWEVCG